MSFPEITSVITGIVLTIESHHALLSLPEFRDRHGRERQGMIVSNEVSKNGSRSMSKYLTVGKPIAVQVLRVDEETGYIDLSRKRVLEEETKQCNQNYSQYKNVRDVLTRVSKDTEMPIYLPEGKDEDENFPCLLTLLLDPLNEIFDTVYEGMAAWETSQKECGELKDSYPEVFSSIYALSPCCMVPNMSQSAAAGPSRRSARPVTPSTALTRTSRPTCRRSVRP